ncbi:Phospho-N-acetylmuramoyl-pentapeptide- transferase [Serinicoccus hydrothermalis]|uniref:Phospho-N-acetylmuramoyl-pentapeptide-transferase n=1 Tax=Serinicoccus hydrothermalis TaxID=1758689 RepID=A0A1B1ND87_9MICO|nr:phospho-N-acetylmuramoyl-pentapeptide-transferase [Serinicoccus hydrothermalis]ANS79386.1 Phospho-N-acetylmuramoyl-pentapeptide- transferase [Serinicoccus hydrothermalis]
MIDVMLAAGISMTLALLCTPAFIRFLVRRRYGQFIRDDLTHHHVKRGKPTMGGAVIIGAALAGYFGSHLLLLLLGATGSLDVEARPISLSALLVLFLLTGLGLIGFFDDYTKISKERSLGLTSGQKLVGQAAVTVVFALAALLVKDDDGRSPASTAISFVRDTPLDLAFAGPVLGVLLFLLWSNLLITGASNGVNITDGLDGLATGASTMVFGAYTVIAMWQASQSCAVEPGVGCYRISDPLDLAVVSAAIAGACFGFLWWNASPAQIIMGDTGSLSLGAALAGMAILTHTQLLLVVLGGLFVIITFSVIIQVISFKLTGRRVFRMAPLHHHFELLGWAEVTIVARFWIIAGICVAAGLGLFYAEWLANL